MRITAVEMDARGACQYQLDIFTSLFGDGAEADGGMGLAGAQAGLDLDWIVRHFLPDPDVVAAFQAAYDAAEAGVETLKAQADAARVAALTSSASGPPPLPPNSAAAAQIALDEAMVAVGEAVNSIPIPIRAQAFSAAFAGR